MTWRGELRSFTMRLLHHAPPFLEESLAKALDQRPEYKAITKKKKIFEERVKIAQGKRLPDVYVAGEYGGKAGDSFAFKENWFFGARLSIPVFDGGAYQCRGKQGADRASKSAGGRTITKAYHHKGSAGCIPEHCICTGANRDSKEDN